MSDSIFDSNVASVFCAFCVIVIFCDICNLHMVYFAFCFLCCLLLFTLVFILVISYNVVFLGLFGYLLIVCYYLYIYFCVLLSILVNIFISF